MITRRHFTTGLGVVAAYGATANITAYAAESDDVGARLVDIEKSIGGRLGVAFRETRNGAAFTHRADELFPLCSTFKVLAAGAVLKQVDEGQAQLGQRLAFTAAEVVDYSPITKPRAGGEGMTLAELCAAAIDYSDNTAGNMLLRQIGGPDRLTRFLRALGDPVTRLDRIEPELNEALPGDPRDTTSPSSMLQSLQTLTLGDVLSPGSRSQLNAWMKANTTGGARVRAGLPQGWTVGDKTGTGERGATNDVAVIWPPDRPPVLLTVYLAETSASLDARNGAIAAVARLAAQMLTRG